MDDTTCEKWKKLSLEKQKSECLSKHVIKKDGMSVIELNQQRKCPYLNEKQLCDLVIELGEDVLSETCAVFPREIHEFQERKEYSLAACCPEVVDLLRQQESVEFTRNLSEIDGNTLFQIRTNMITMMKDQEIPIQKCLMIIYYFLLDLDSMDQITEDVLCDYQKKVKLAQISDAIEQMQFSNLNMFEERNELFLDLVQNYKNEKMYANYLKTITQSAEKFAACYDEKELEMQLHLFETQMLQYDKLFRNYLVSELFTNSLLQDSDLEGIIVMVQWIAIEYSMIRHVLFLDLITDDSKELDYSRMRDLIVIVSRMTGYDEEDIYEYLEDSFENIVWEWGYLALIVGYDKTIRE